MWLFFQIVAYLMVAFAIGAAGAWVLRSRMAEDSLEHLRQRFRQMVSSSEMERDAARLRVRELAQRVEELEARLEERPADGASTAEREEPRVPDTEDEAGHPPRPESGVPDASNVSAATDDMPPDGAETSDEEPEIGAPSDYGSVPLGSDSDDGERSSWTAPEREETRLQPPLSFEEGNGLRDRGAPRGEGPGKDADVRVEVEAGGTAGGGHPLSHLGEVPPEVANALRSMGIHDTTALHRHFQNGYDPALMARKLEVEARRMRRWRILSELLEVPDLAPESAWLLEISGVASLSDLAAEDPGELADRMAGINQDQGLGLPSPAQDQVASWVLWASQAGAVQV